MACPGLREWHVKAKKIDLIRGILRKKHYTRDEIASVDLISETKPIRSFSASKQIIFIYCTGRMGWMAQRKWIEIKQQPIMLPGPAVPGSCLVSFYFRWAIHPIRPVVVVCTYLIWRAHS